MFTGLVEGQGKIVQIIAEGSGLRLNIAPPWSCSTSHSNISNPSTSSIPLTSGSKTSTPTASTQESFNKPLAVMGESIAINGCCLTVVEIAGNCLSFQAGEETLRRTNLGELRVGSSVNMERSLKIGDSLGGHLVQGHIDGTGKILEILKEGEWTTIYFSVPEQFSHYLVSKGSIAVDGVSLTVVDTQPDRFSVALIPHTLQVTTMGTKQKGDVVNLEFDIIAKQIARLAEPILKKLAGVK